MNSRDDDVTIRRAGIRVRGCTCDTPSVKQNIHTWRFCKNWQQPVGMFFEPLPILKSNIDEKKNIDSK